MPKNLNEELVMTYIKDYNDLVEDLPNDLSRNITQLHNYSYYLEKLLNKLNKNSLKLTKCKSIKHKSKYFIKIQNYLIRLQDISDQRLKITQKILDKIQSKSIFLFFLYFFFTLSLGLLKSLN
jgi:hypothetical protein